MTSDLSRPYPSVWLEFERTINGKSRKFWVQDLPEDWKERALDYFCKYYTRDQAIGKALNMSADERSMQFARLMWGHIIAQKCTLACFTELEDGTIEMAAVNYCCTKSVYEEDIVDSNGMNETPLKLIIDVIKFVFQMKKPFKELGVDRYLCAVGLLVLPQYRGHNIGLEVLKSRRYLCGALGIKASMNTFSSAAAQKLAEKAGFKDLVNITYDEIAKMDPSLKIPNINTHSTSIRLMYILYE